MQTKVINKTCLKCDNECKQLGMWSIIMCKKMKIKEEKKQAVELANIESNM